MQRVEASEHVDRDPEGSFPGRRSVRDHLVEGRSFEERTEGPRHAFRRLDLRRQDEPGPHGALLVRRRERAGQRLGQLLDDDGGAVRSLRAEHAEDSAAVGDDPVDVDPIQDRRTLDGVASHQRLQRCLEEGDPRGIGIARVGAEARARSRPDRSQPRLDMSVLQRFDLALARRHDRSQVPGDLRHLFLDHLEVVGAHRHGAQRRTSPGRSPSVAGTAGARSRPPRLPVRASSGPHRPS